MSKTIEIGPYSAYAIAVKYGYVGTEEDWIKSVEAARKSAETSAANAKREADGASASAAIATEQAGIATAKAGESAASADASASSASAAATSEANAKKYSEEAGAKANTDKTLTIENAPADAKQVGDELAVRYTKEQVDALLTKYKADWLLAAYPVGSLYMSTNATSPAELFGGTWEQIKDKFILAAGDTYAAGSVGGKASVALEARNIPRLWGQSLAFDVSGNNFHVAQWGWVVSARQISSQNGFNAYDGLYVTVGDDNNSAVDVMPPYVAKYVWQRIE